MSAASGSVARSLRAVPSQPLSASLPTSSIRAKCIDAFRAVKVDRALGLDINLTSTGWALIDKHGIHLNSGIVDLSKTPDLYDKASMLEEEVFKVLGEAQKGHKTPLKIAVGVEDFVRAFGGMSWRTVDIMRLAQVNSILSYALYKRTGERPTKFYPSSYRSFFNLKKGPKDDIKKVSFAYVSKLLPDYPWSYARTGTLQKSNFDIVDAYLCARFTLKRYPEDVLLANAALREEFTTTLGERFESAAKIDGPKWEKKCALSWAKEARTVSDHLFPKLNGTPAISGDAPKRKRNNAKSADSAAVSAVDADGSASSA